MILMYRIKVTSSEHNVNRKSQISKRPTLDFILHRSTVLSEPMDHLYKRISFAVHLRNGMVTLRVPQNLGRNISQLQSSARQ